MSEIDRFTSYKLGIATCLTTNTLNRGNGVQHPMRDVTADRKHSGIVDNNPRNSAPQWHSTPPQQPRLILLIVGYL